MATTKTKTDAIATLGPAEMKKLTKAVHDLGEWLAGVAKVNTAEGVLRLREVLDSDKVKAYIEQSMKVEKSTTPEAAGAAG